MRALGRWALLAATVVVCAGLGYAAYMLAGASWDAVVKYRSPYVSLPLPPAQSASAVSSRTVLVIVDGLELDASLQMPTLNRLRDYGADLVLTAPQPALSYPNWTTLLSGAPPYMSGVVTNWHKGAVPVETLFDTAASTGIRTVFVGPDDFEQLYGVKRNTVASFMRKWDEKYLTATYVDAALDLTGRFDPTLVVIHLPDIDEAGHRSGTASSDYAGTVARVDGDLGRLVTGLQDGSTTFVVVADHGHISTGGHGGWEPDVTDVPAVFAGTVVPLGKGRGRSEDIAPTVAVLAGVPVPRQSSGSPLRGVIDTSSPLGTRAALEQLRTFTIAADGVITAPVGDAAPSVPRSAGPMALRAALSDAQSKRLAWDRQGRAGIALIGAAMALVALALIGVGSWRALLAGLSGSAAFYALYSGLFFGVHRYAWSLSAFNSEDRMKAWMNGRLMEAALSVLVAALVAALVYPLLRRVPRGPRGTYLAGWLTLGPATVLTIMATLGLQIAWFIWAWGIDPTWRLPDLMWAFKYDLDLVQATAIGFAAVLTPLVTYLVGRYHPRVRVGGGVQARPASGSPYPTADLTGTPLPNRSEE